jgi:hypothetical protein
MLLPGRLVPQIGTQITKEMSNLLVKVVSQDCRLLKYESDAIDQKEGHPGLSSSSTVDQLIMDSVLQQKYRNKGFAGA